VVGSSNMRSVAAGAVLVLGEPLTPRRLALAGALMTAAVWLLARAARELPLGSSGQREAHQPAGASKLRATPARAARALTGTRAPFSDPFGPSPPDEGSERAPRATARWRASA
jgi:hypothetical protein